MSDDDESYRVEITNDNGGPGHLVLPVQLHTEPEYDEHGALRQKINPQKLTPATRRLRRGLIGAYSILIASLFVALHASTNAAQQRARCVAWDEAHLVAVRVTDPLSLTDPRLTPELVTGRIVFNSEQATRRVKILAALGPRPSC